ncbi:hypothetical protein EsDP_00006934 [Epichloe bromicola]|uniref:Uncharacterized protein n=1 Tax=Epichloe bromicola TaxID=79588 RepID=A0ABQ0CZ61_9HYPO
MGLRDMLKKKDEAKDAVMEREEAMREPNGAEFTFIRTDATSQEVIQPPGDGENQNLVSPKKSVRSPRRSLDVFRSSRDRSASVSSQASHSSKRRLSERLHLSRSPESSDYVPQNLPVITASTDPTDQSQWEKRATMLAGQSLVRGTPGTPAIPENVSQTSPNSRQRSPGPAPVSTKAIDEDIQQAIRLHEEGNLSESTMMFGRLADPRGANNPLSQVLYGLALRHGWGCEPDPPNAVKYLTAAASNSAAVEQLALQAGMTKGGAAKGELVMAIYELANCFRHGWGIEQDPFAARQYYETAANLGDSDAMNDAAWCYEHGFGGKKDKFTAARYYRLAEKAGNKTMGNSWIWKDKYDPEQQTKKK